MRGWLVTAVVCGLGVGHAFSQNSMSQEPAEGKVVMTKLAPPVYPPLARQARIAAEVKVSVSIRPDGRVESVAPFSGHPMLVKAAMESARQSTFQCRDCHGSGSTDVLTYKFAIGDQCADYGPHCDRIEDRAPQIEQSDLHVTLTVDPLCTCDPAVSITRLKWRAAKCLYLWHCASRVTDVQ